MPSHWTIDELCEVLISGKAFTSEPTEDAPWPKYLDDQYRRQVAAMDLAAEFGSCQRAIDALSQYALTGQNDEVRLTCARELGKISQVAPLIPRLIDDQEPDLRVYALEFILTEFPDQIQQLAPDVRNDQSWEIQETLECFDSEKPPPLFHYERPTTA